VASHEGLVAAENALGANKKIDYTVVPNCIFTDPEIGSVGYTEDAARQKGYEVKVGRFPFMALGKAHALGETEGFVKLVGDAKTQQILGGQILGPHATDLIAEVAVAMKLESTMAELEETIHAHPTLSEGIMEAAGNFYGRAIHVP
jgi:dihydrolipoamide dehydrogenase